MFPGLGGATPERAWFGWGINDPVHGRNGTLDSERRHVAVINLEILRRAWGEEKFSWQGEHYTIPVPGIRYQQHPGVSIREGYADENGNLIKLSVVPRPVQTPMPRLWAVTNFPEGFVSAAKAGLGGIGSMASTSAQIAATFRSIGVAGAGNGVASGGRTGSGEDSGGSNGIRTRV
jgi:alkanesulfonate monooxygenase SsuD/methylene tetrahydromethanopterin reductase-like flavin-dependent oxidoreductase (luciferase family)